MSKLLRVDGIVKFFNLNKEHTKNIRVEIAETTEEQSFGLMNRDPISLDEGMLFPYQEPEQASMWMKNVRFPLDIIFIDDRQLIMNIYRMTKPLSSTLYNSNGLCKYVVEVVGGFCDTYRIAKDQKIEIVRNTGNLRGD